MDGILKTIATPLGSILAFFYDIVPDFGWSIIALTLLINLVLFPLTLKQTRATRAFSQMQPEVRKLQAEHKDDSKKLQEEMIKLQREHGASPTGCLGPMLVQMPIWFALFRLLRTPLEFIPSTSALHDTIEAGNTIWFAMDLTVTPSAAFAGGVLATLPYILAIVVMVGGQFLQQAYTQAATPQDTSNPQVQMTQNITKFLPFMFGIFAWNFQAGLIVYWGTSNLFRLGQQAVIYKMDGRPTPPDSGPEKAKNEPKEGPQPPKKAQGSAKKRQRRRRN